MGHCCQKTPYRTATSTGHQSATQTAGTVALRRLTFLLILCTAATASQGNGGERVPVVAILPPVALNKGAENQATLEGLNERLYEDLGTYPQLRLLELKDVLGVLERERFRQDGVTREVVQRIARALAADLLLLPTIATYEKSGLASPEFLDLWVLDGKTGKVIAAADEEADRIPTASSIIYPLQGERFERMVAAAVAHCTGERHEGGPLVGVLPFEEPGEDVRGRALATMVATRLMRNTEYRVELCLAPWAKGKTPREGAIQTLLKAGAKRALEGKIVERENELPVAEFWWTDVQSGKRSRTVRVALTSDANLRLAASDIALHSAPGGEHILWMRRAQACSSPVLAGGRVVFGAEAPSLVCLSSTSGATVWEREMVGAFGSPPQRLVGTEESVIVQYRSGGIEVFETEAGKSVTRSPNVPPASWPFSPILRTAERLFFTSGDRELLAYLLDEDLSGKEPRWSAKAMGPLNSAPALGDGLVFIGCDDHHLYALEAEMGKLKWKFLAGDRVRSRPYCVNGRVCFGTEGARFVALETKTGSKVWSAELSDSIRAEAVAYEDSLIVGDCAGQLVSLVANAGKLNWRTDLDGPILACPLRIGSTGLVVTASGRIYRLNLKSGEAASLIALGDQILTQPVLGKTEDLVNSAGFSADDGFTDSPYVLVVTTASGRVLALGVRE